MRILIVDDDEVITQSVKLGLERKGYAVDTYNDPLKALIDFKRGRYSLVFIDLRMPGMSGINLYRRLRVIDDMVKLCFLTSFRVYKREFEILIPDLGVDCFFEKPVSIVDMLTFIDHVSQG